MKENDSKFLHRQAEICIALSRATFDLTVAGRLRRMAEEFHQKASDWDDEAEDFVPFAARRNGSTTGESSPD